MIHFGIIHYTKRTRHTLPECIASLHAAGCSSLVVYPDAGEYGARGNFHRALHDLWRRAMPGDFVCVVDDDLVVHHSAIARSVALYSDTEQNIPHELRDRLGWIEAPVGIGSWGGMVVLHRDLVPQVLAKMDGELMEDPALGRAPDAVLYEALNRNGTKVLHHLPSLADDIGHGASTIGNEHTPDTAGFRFKEWTHA
jgi:hypothetical protein